jgi:hypothetical protein
MERGIKRRKGGGMKKGRYGSIPFMWKNILVSRKCMRKLESDTVSDQQLLKETKN